MLVFIILLRIRPSLILVLAPCFQRLCFCPVSAEHVPGIPQHSQTIHGTGISPLQPPQSRPRDGLLSCVSLTAQDYAAGPSCAPQLGSLDLDPKEGFAGVYAFGEARERESKAAEEREGRVCKMISGSGVSKKSQCVPPRYLLTLPVWVVVRTISSRNPPRAPSTASSRPCFGSTTRRSTGPSAALVSPPQRPAACRCRARGTRRRSSPRWARQMRGAGGVERV